MRRTSCRQEPAVISAQAPARVSFGGGGTDLEAYYARYGGFVVSAAITRYASVTVRPIAGERSQIRSADYGLREIYSPGELVTGASPLALPKAVLGAFAERGYPSAADLFLTSQAAPGTGLGSSSAMAVGLTRALAGYHGWDMDARECAEFASEIEI